MQQRQSQRHRRRGRTSTPQGTDTNAAANTSNNNDYDYDNDNDILDTDDQRALIQSMEEDAQGQSQQFQRAFGVVGGVGGILSLVLVVLCPDECAVRPVSCGVHAVGAAITHIGSICWSRTATSLLSSSFNSKPSTSTSTSTTTTTAASLPSDSIRKWLGVAVALAHVIPTILWMTRLFARDTEYFHAGLLLGNLVTWLGAFVLRWDAASTRRALDDLNGAKYEHKSL